MQIYILDTDYEAIAYIDTTESTLWNKKYNDVGECEIYIPCSLEMLSVLRKGHYLFRYDDDMVCKIEKVQIETDVENGDYIIATAVDISKILAGRIVRWNTVFSGKVVHFIKRLIEDNVIYPKDGQKQPHTARFVPNFVFDMTEEEMSAFDEYIETTVNAEDLLKLIKTTCKAYNYGFRTSLDIDTKTLKFKLYKGVNRTLHEEDGYVEFSKAYGNILTSDYQTDDSNYKNVAYVGYNTLAGWFQLLSTFITSEEPVGEERKEIYIDATSTSRDISYEELLQMYPDVKKESGIDSDGEAWAIYTVEDNGKRIVADSVGEGEEEKITVSEYTYLKLIREIGRNALKQNVVTESFSGAVDVVETYRYKEDYDIGDIVKVVTEQGIEADARIVEIMESEDNNNGYVVEPRFEYKS